MTRFTVVLSPEAAGYVVAVPALPGALSQGDSRDEALANIAEAIAGWLSAAADAGQPMPTETFAMIAAKVEEVLRFRAELGLDPTIETALVELPAVAAA